MGDRTFGSTGHLGGNEVVRVDYISQEQNVEGEGGVKLGPGMIAIEGTE